MIMIPKFFHELLGEKQTKASLILILFFVVLSGVLLGTLTFKEWIALPLMKQILAWLLFVDIAGGVIANLTKGTDMYYTERPKARWLFIAIHVQPLILAWTLDASIGIAAYIWGYTISAVVILNILRRVVYHRELAGCFLGIGLMLVLYFYPMQPLFITVLYCYYMFKLIYSFSVQHHKEKNHA